MRWIEALLVLANILAFIVLVVPLPVSAHWLRYFALLPMVAATGQVVFEGPRWQMGFAYLLAGLLCLAWITGWRANHGLMIGLGSLGLVLSAVLPIALPAFQFPKPSGPYAVGTLTYHWVDEEREEIFTENSSDHRELMVQVWYPARVTASSPRAPYIKDASALASALSGAQSLPQWLFGNLEYINGNAYQAVPVADDQPKYPVLIFTEGLTGFRQMNTFQVEELVSHGYIVAAIDQPYTASTVVYPDGRRVDMPPITQIRPLARASYIPAEETPLLNGKPLAGGSIIPYLAQDVVFTLDRLAALNQSDPNGILTGRMDLGRTGAFGVSLGGITGAESCRIDPRLRACLLMDAPMPLSVVEEGLRQPTMWITREAKYMRLERERSGGWSEEEINAHQASMRAVYDSLPVEGYFVQVPGIFHIDYTDAPSWSPIFAWLSVTGPNGIQRSHDILNAYSVAFFDRYLKGQLEAGFDQLVERYPDVQLERHGWSTSEER